jgi:hypothetical protein
VNCMIRSGVTGALVLIDVCPLECVI